MHANNSLVAMRTFAQIYENLRPPQIDTVIAGGAVVNFEKAKDIDLFVFSRDLSDFLGIRTALGAEVGGSFREFDERPYEGGHCDEFYRFGPIESPLSDKPIHLTGFDAPAGCTDKIRALLETFDLSIHAWAVDRRLRIRRIEGSTYPFDPIRVYHTRSTTAARLVKLTQRYHPTPQPA